jgi:cell division protein FtsI (penicillin-binding protein 3)
VTDENPCRPRHFKPPPCTPAPLDGPAKVALDTSHTRILITASLLSLAFLVISAQLVWVTTVRGGNAHVANHLGPAAAPPERADIVDRHGMLLATTLQTPSLFGDPTVFADPKRHLDPREAARKLVSVLPDLDEPWVVAQLGSGRKSVWLRHQVTPREEAEINRLGVAGVEFQGVGKRIYPDGRLLSAVLGYTDLNGAGQAGIERGLDAVLRSGGRPVQLSVDLRLQYLLHDQIARQMADFHADGGMGLIMDVRTGEVLAMVSLPDFDPNDPGDATANETTLGVFEMGSVFKIFTTAMALDTGTVTLASGFDATRPIQYGRFTIHDDHPQARYLTVPEIFKYSSNIGSAKMALAVGGQQQRAYLGRLDLLSAPEIEIPEVSAPLFPHNWREINTLTIGFGHGISVSPLQVATAVSAVVNGGILHRPTLQKIPDGTIPAGERVLSPQTSLAMRKLLRLVVEEGTGKFAEAKGYVVGGKTGTAEKVSGHHYARNALLSSFVGVFPMNDPRYLVMISIDQPHGNAASHGYATGGWVAAPAVGRTIERMASLVGIQPVDEDSPEIRHALDIDLPGAQGRKLAAN